MIAGKKHQEGAAMRINVVGTSGSGKSTLSKRIAQIIGGDYIELDLLFWRPNWVQASDEEFFEVLRGAINSAGEHGYVIDGNYTRTLPIKWERIDMVVWLDLPFARNFLQSLWRGVRRGITRTELWPGTGNRENLWKLFFSRDSILLWMINTHAKNRAQYAAMMTNPQFAHIKFIRLKSHLEAEQFCSELASMKCATMK